MSVDVQRVLVLGASGMLGHEAVRVLAPDFEVFAALRETSDVLGLGLDLAHALAGLDAFDIATARTMFEVARPDMVINAVGIIKQVDESKAAVPSITVNSLWPHQLAQLCAEFGARLIHPSTDCVFSGTNCPEGGYRESDTPDATDLYGRSKLLGEVTEYPHALTIRTSIIGWQIGVQNSLIGWFAEHRHEPNLKGYTRAVFSGLSTTALTETIRDYVFERPDLHGLYHVSLAPIDKFTLLSKLAAACGWDDVDLTPVNEPRVDKTLNSERFQDATGWVPSQWDTIIEGLARQYDVHEECL
ncbi:MAG: SDR family oxidoreductase [Coriobacteriia bacterium]|nr:SDR family oxidoreductase [Coriobacteriia bacterium]